MFSDQHPFMAAVLATKILAGVVLLAYAACTRGKKLHSWETV